MKAWPADVAQGTITTPVTPTNWNKLVDGITDVKEYQAKGMVFNVAAYGATGDGVADDTSAIEDARDEASPGDIIFFPPGEYKVTSTITITKAITLLGAGMGASVINGSTIAGSGRIFIIEGEITATNAVLTGDAAISQPDIDIGAGDIGDYSADDWIRIRSDEGFNESAVTKLGELQLIEGIAVNTITCTQNLTDTYVVAVHAATIDLLTMLNSVRIEGLKFVGRGIGDTSEWWGVDIRQATNVLVKDCWFIDCYATALTIQDCVKFHVSGCNFENSISAATGYGVVISDASRDGTVSGNNFINNRHALTTGGTSTYGVNQNVVVANNSVRYTDLATRINPFTWHNTCRYITLSNNSIIGDGLVSLNGTDLIVSCNSCYQDVTSNSSLTMSRYTKRVAITGNTIYDTQNKGIRIANDCNDVLIANNHIEATGDKGIEVIQDSSDIQILNNYIESGGGEGVYVHNPTPAGATERISISNNIIKSGASSCIRFSVATENIDYVRIAGNVLQTSGICINLNDAGVGSKVRYVQIVENIIEDCSYGISCQGVQYFDICNNTIISASSGGILIQTGGAGCADYRLHPNRFVSCAADIVDQVDTEDALGLFNVILQNTASEDGAGKRESSISWKGEQTGHEVSTLAKILAEHFGAVDDEKGALKFYVNDGNDGNSPTLMWTLDCNGQLSSSGTKVEHGAVGAMSGNETFAAGDGNLFIKDPDGAGRNFNPSGTFAALTRIEVINTADGAETITFDSAGLNQAIAQNERGIFAYDGSDWLAIFVG